MFTGKRHLTSSYFDAVDDCSAPFLNSRGVEPPHGDPSHTKNEDSYGEFDKRLAEEQVLHLVAIVKSEDLVEIFALHRKQLQDPDLDL